MLDAKLCLKFWIAHPLATTEIGAELIFRHDSKSSLNSIAMSRIRVSEWTDAQTNELVVVSPVLE